MSWNLRARHPQEDLLEALFGNFQRLPLVGFLLGTAGVILVVAFLVGMKDRLIMDLFSLELAAATGVKVARLDVGLLLVFRSWSACVLCEHYSRVR